MSKHAQRSMSYKRATAARRHATRPAPRSTGPTKNRPARNAEPLPRRREPKWWYVMGAVAVVAIAGLAIGLGLTGGSGIPSPTVGAAEAVRAAVTSALANGGAQVTTKGTMRAVVDNKTLELSMTGSGGTNFVNDLTNEILQVKETEPLSWHGSIHELMIGNTSYEGGQFIENITSGLPWASFTIGAIGGTPEAEATDNPALTSAEYLEALGGTDIKASDLGTARIDGVPVRRYYVTVPASTVPTAIANLHLNAAQTAAINAAFSGVTKVTYHVDVSTLDNEIHQISYTVPLITKGLRNGSMSVTVTYDNFGAAITVKAPAPDTVKKLNAADLL